MILASPEYYILVCCESCEQLKVNDKPTVFEFTGESYNDIIPDIFMDKIAGNIKTLANFKVKGCYKVEPVDEDCDLEMYQIISWKSFFKEADVFENCEDCLPEKEPEKRIYMKRWLVDKPEDPCAQKFIDYTKLIYSTVMEKIEGISMCCVPDRIKTIVEYKRVTMAREIEMNVCCPPCVFVDVFLPAGTVGTYTYTDCSGTLISVDVSNVIDETQRICVCVKAFYDIQFTGTSSGFLATPTGIPCS